MALLTQRYAASFLGRRYRDDGPELRILPEVIVLPARDGHRPDPRPPVRIFAGTETAQFRAERVFVWSIEQVRDPARRYEIHLMKNLAGFRRKLWLTGFTNYRFAVPHLAGAEGRAIYNDVDQVYLADPADLFDLDMEGCGYRSISDQDTSVMLIDCARMAAIWRLDDAMHRPRRVLDGASRAVPGLWGPIDPGWNARDSEYAPGRAKVLHFTEMRTQPWRPLPDEYVYADNPVGGIWFGLERSADEAGFTTFTADRPSAAFRALASRLGATQGAQPPSGVRGWSGEERRRLATLLERHDARDVVHASLLGDAAPPLDGQARLRALDPSAEPAPADAVVATGSLEPVPDDDVPWMLDWLFGHARDAVFLRIDDATATVTLPDGGAMPRVPRGATWWQAQLEAASARHPGIHWVAGVRARQGRWISRIWFEGGPRFGQAPSVWVLASEKTGHTSQAVGIAEALGASYTVKDVRLSLGMLLSLFAGRDLPRAPGRAASDLGPPWPDMAIASGWLPTRVARRIRAQSGGRTSVVLLGRKAGALRDPSDIIVSCSHFGLPAHPRRIETVLPPSQVSYARLYKAAERWTDLVSGAPAPRVVMLVGGGTKAHRFDPDFARQIGYSVSQAVERIEGALFVVTSRRTGEEATKALRRALPISAQLHAWRKDETDNPFLGYLAQADVLVVTGDSESMLAEAVGTGAPVYIVPVPAKPAGPWQRFCAWVARRGNTRPENYRGTARPQQGLEYLCARMIDRGFVLPPRDLDALHRNLVALGLARMFDGDVTPFERPAYNSTAEIATGVRRLLGMDAAPTSAKPADPENGLASTPQAS